MVTGLLYIQGDSEQEQASRRGGVHLDDSESRSNAGLEM